MAGTEDPVCNTRGDGCIFDCEIREITFERIERREASNSTQATSPRVPRDIEFVFEKFKNLDYVLGYDWRTCLS